MNAREMSEQEANDIDEAMARQIEERQRHGVEWRQLASPVVAVERRTVCSYCFEPGNHPTAKDCFRALERDLSRRRS